MSGDTFWEDGVWRDLRAALAEQHDTEVIMDSLHIRLSPRFTLALADDGVWWVLDGADEKDAGSE